MSPTATLAAYGAALAIVFGAAVGIGAAVGPVGTAGTDHSTGTDGHQSPGTTTHAP